MATDMFETFYESDWGHGARKARDSRRQMVMRETGPSGVTRGKVKHPIFGTGYDLFYRRDRGQGTADLRVTRQGIVPQMPPTVMGTEERWVPSPDWIAPETAWAN